MSRTNKVNWENSVLVTGAHRSGTTWVGRALSQVNGTVYVHEPLSPNQQIGKTPIRYFYQYFSGGKSKWQVDQLKELLNDRVVFSTRYLLNRMLAGTILDRLHYAKECVKSRMMRKRIIKDPHALFLAEWFSQEYHINVLIMVRHPAAFVYSLIKKQWHFDFKNFSQQPELMSGPLLSYNDEIISYADSHPSILDQGILLWKILNSHVYYLMCRHKDWMILRHEDLARDPEIKFRKIFRKLNYNWSPKARKYLSNSINPLKSHRMSRDITDTMYAWKSGLKDEEILKIKEGTNKVWQLFYSEKDW